MDRDDNTGKMKKITDGLPRPFGARNDTLIATPFGLAMTL